MGVVWFAVLICVCGGGGGGGGMLCEGIGGSVGACRCGYEGVQVCHL